VFEASDCINYTSFGNSAWVPASAGTTGYRAAYSFISRFNPTRGEPGLSPISREVPLAS
jgi:hypothetical protein